LSVLPEGLIAFGSLALHPNVKVIFADITASLLTHSRQLATEAGALDRCEFIEARVLRVLPGPKPRGRVSIFEPINIFGCRRLNILASMLRPSSQRRTN